MENHGKYLKKIGDIKFNRTNMNKRKLNSEKQLFQLTNFSIEKLRNFPLNKLMRNKNNVNFLPKIQNHSNNKKQQRLSFYKVNRNNSEHFVNDELDKENNLEAKLNDQYFEEIENNNCNDYFFNKLNKKYGYSKDNSLKPNSRMKLLPAFHINLKNNIFKSNLSNDKDFTKIDKKFILMDNVKEERKIRNSSNSLLKISKTHNLNKYSIIAKDCDKLNLSKEKKIYLKFKYYVLSEAGMMFENNNRNNMLTTQNQKLSFKKISPKINQDRVLCLQKILGLEFFHIFAIFDGHGNNGHHISQEIMQSIEDFFLDSNNFYIPIGSQNFSCKIKNLVKFRLSPEYIYDKLMENKGKLIIDCINQIQKKLELRSYSDLSGSTLCMIIIINNKIISVNIGDSRAIMIKSDKIINLTKDHKPDIPKERQRIEACGGEIKKINDPNAPLRVWKRGVNLIGLAMSRSMGDTLAKKIGVNNEPDIKEFNIDSNCYFIVLASDGIWEMISNEEVDYICKNNMITNNPEKDICQKLYENAKEKFISKMNYVDDISIILINLIQNI